MPLPEMKVGHIYEVTQGSECFEEGDRIILLDNGGIVFINDYEGFIEALDLTEVEGLEVKES
jgi:hypothetical protein